MRTLYDAVTPGNIPTGAQMVAGYVDGRYAWQPSDWARFPGAVKVRIAVFPSTNDGHVLDVERYDATPAQAVGWVQRRRAAGVDPTVYCGYSTNGYSWALVIDAFKSAGVPEPHYWVAAYPGIGAQLYPGSVAHQYANPGLYDLSVVADYWPGVDVTTAANVTTTDGTVPPVSAATLPVPLEVLVSQPITVQVAGEDAIYFADLSTGVFYQVPDVESLGVVQQYSDVKSVGANARQRDLIRALCRSAATSLVDPAALAQAVVAGLPAGASITPGQVQAAVSSALGTLTLVAKP